MKALKPILICSMIYNQIFMKKLVIIPVIALISVSFLLINSYLLQKTQEQTASLSSAIKEIQSQTLPEREKKEKYETIVETELAQDGKTLYRGFFFDIEYPEKFTSRPI